jgi:hypothetical protein
MGQLAHALFSARKIRVLIPLISLICRRCALSPLAVVFAETGQLPAEGVRLLLDALAAEGWGVWEDGAAGGGGGGTPRSHFLLSPSRRLSELGEAIWTHAHALGEGSGLLTIYELQTADTMKGTGPLGQCSAWGVGGKIVLTCASLRRTACLLASCSHPAHILRFDLCAVLLPLVAAPAAFYGLDAMLLLGAVRWLESRGRCAVIPSPVVAETGVKLLG